MITAQDKAGLAWIHRWACARLTELKRKRKYAPPGNFSDAELEYGRALCRLRDGSRVILGRFGESEPRGIRAVLEEELDRSTFREAKKSR